MIKDRTKSIVEKTLIQSFVRSFSSFVSFGKKFIISLNNGKAGYLNFYLTYGKRRVGKSDIKVIDVGDSSLIVIDTNCFKVELEKNDLHLIDRFIFKGDAYGNPDGLYLSYKDNTSIWKYAKRRIKKDGEWGTVFPDVDAKVYGRIRKLHEDEFMNKMKETSFYKNEIQSKVDKVVKSNPTFTLDNSICSSVKGYRSFLPVFNVVSSEQCVKILCTEPAEEKEKISFYDVVAGNELKEILDDYLSLPVDHLKINIPGCKEESDDTYMVL